MSILNLNGPQQAAPRGRKTTKILLGVGLLVAVLGFGSTFAANITLNNGNSPTEFGQGVQQTVYCGGASATLTVKPFSAFKSSTNSFAVGGITVSGIPADCNNRNFVISVYKDGSDTRQTIASSSGTLLVTPTVFWTTGNSSYVIENSDNRSSIPNCQKRKSSSPGTASSGGAILSLSSTGYSAPCAVAYLSSVTPGNLGAFTITVVTSGTTLMSLADFDKITIETQNDAFGALATTSSGAYGLVNN